MTVVNDSGSTPMVGVKAFGRSPSKLFIKLTLEYPIFIKLAFEYPYTEF